MSNLVTIDVTSEFREIKTRSLRKFTIDIHEFPRESTRWKNLHGQITSEYSFMQR